MYYGKITNVVELNKYRYSILHINNIKMLILYINKIHKIISIIHILYTWQFDSPISPVHFVDDS